MSLIEFRSSAHGGHSADVRISLLSNGHTIPVAHLGPGFLLLDAPNAHPLGDASIVLRVPQLIPTILARVLNPEIARPKNL